MYEQTAYNQLMRSQNGCSCKTEKRTGRSLCYFPLKNWCSPTTTAEERGGTLSSNQNFWAPTMWFKSFQTTPAWLNGQDKQAGWKSAGWKPYTPVNTEPGIVPATREPRRRVNMWGAALMRPLLLSVEQPAFPHSKLPRTSQEWREDSQIEELLLFNTRKETSTRCPTKRPSRPRRIAGRPVRDILTKNVG